MLDDQLTLLDGTEVMTIGAAAHLTGLDFYYVWDRIVVDGAVPAETVLDGTPYFSRDKVLGVLEDAR